MLDRRDLTVREQSFWLLIDASHERNEPRRHDIVSQAALTLTADEMYLASSVIALFNFYNTFVDLNGVDELSAEMYDASGVRLSTLGYTPPVPPTTEIARSISAPALGQP